jgi:cobalt-zinc-cadmium efflux system membrane fusion protein
VRQDDRVRNGADADPEPKVELVKGQSDTLDVPAGVAKSLGLKAVEVTADATPRQLRLDGTLFVDPSNLSRVHARFAGEVVELGTENTASTYGPPSRLRFGDRVRKGQLLAVVWSKDLGEKKSELVDAIQHRRLDEDTLKRLQDLSQQGATPEQKLRDARHNVEADQIAETRAERTLRSWRLSDKEIDAIRAEADDLHERRKVHDPRSESNWSRVEVLAPIDGVLVEVNVGPGDIVDTTLDLFKLADLSRLRVQCQVYEEDLPLLQDLSDAERVWTVHVGNDRQAQPTQGEVGRFDQLGRIIDPNTHTAQVMGWVDNPDSRLLIGQFVTATVSLRPPKNQVTVPVSAVIESGAGASVFVEQPDQSNGGGIRVQKRKVALAREGDESVGIVSQPSKEQRRQGVQPLAPHDVVVAGGALQLAAELEDQQTGK